MKTRFSALLLRVGVCALASLLSIGVGLALGGRPDATTAATTAGVIVREPLSLAEFRAMVDGGEALVIDARDEISYARGHVPRALSLSERRFDARYAQLESLLTADLGRPIVLYCGNPHCGASTGVQARLLELGHANVAVFSEGWDAWKSAAYPEESDASAVVLTPWKNSSSNPDLVSPP